MIANINGIPVFNALITDDETGMNRISLVDVPAVDSTFLAFNAQNKTQLYAVKDEEKRIVRGVVMRADYPIYRKDKERGEFYFIMKPEAIRLMAEKYLLESKQNEVNLMHEKDSDVEGVQMVQWFIKDSNAGINPAGFDDIAEGSLFAEFHVVNDDVWQAIKDGTYKGFSLEGVFELQAEQNQEEVDKMEESMEGLFSKLNKVFKMKKGKFLKFMEALSKIIVECGNVTTDKGILYWDTEEDLKEGDEVFVEDAEGNRTAAEDGDYTTADSKVITVVDGKVSVIKDAEAEVASQGDGENAEEELKKVKPLFRRVAETFESYEEKEKKMLDAIKEKGVEYPWIVEAAEDYAVVEVWDEEKDEYKYLRFPITWDENGNAIAGDASEVKLVFAPIDAESPAEEDFSKMNTAFNKVCEEFGLSKEEGIEGMATMIAELKKENEKLKKQPLGRPAHEEMEASSQAPKTGNKGLDNLARIMKA